MIVANFTPDIIPWMHIGVGGNLKPGDIVDWDEARAKHVLNKMGARGLVRMQYGDNENVKRDQAMEIYNNFWMTQITNFNQGNEARKNENKPYSPPTAILKEHAAKIGVKLLGPWTHVKSDSAAMAELRDKNIALEDQLNKLMDMVEKLAGSTKGAGTGTVQPGISARAEGEVLPDAKIEIPVEGGNAKEGAEHTGTEPLTDDDAARKAAGIPPESDARFWTTLLKEVHKLNKSKFAKLVREDLDKIKLYPADVKIILQGKWDEQNQAGVCPFS